MNSKQILIIAALIFFINCYVLQRNINRIKTVEKFATSPEDIKKHISQVYKVDIEAIRNLSDIADRLQGKGKYKNKKIVLPGNLEIRDSLTVGRNFNYLPRGTIVIYNGTKAPSGWALCNGSNGTPDLRGRFVYGYGLRSGKTWKRSGGSETHKLSTNEMPKHSHSNRCSTSNAGNHRHYYTKFPSGRGNIAAGRYWKASGSYTGYSGNHSHRCSVSIYNKGGSRAHNNMPPYVVLSYIMKL